MTRPRLMLIGAGGHAKVLLDALFLSGDAEPVAIVDGNPSRKGTDLMGVQIIGGDEEIVQGGAHGATHFTVAFGSVGNPAGRRAAWERAIVAGLIPFTVIHPNATVSRYAEIGEGTHILAGVCVNASAKVGKCVIINTGSVIEHDCQLGDFVHVASGAAITGGVKVGKGTHIGGGSSILQGITIGEEALVGLGSVVIRDVPDGARVAGVPAKPLPVSAQR